jgi:hypothetical protein
VKTNLPTADGRTLGFWLYQLIRFSSAWYWESPRHQLFSGAIKSCWPSIGTASSLSFARGVCELWRLGSGGYWLKRDQSGSHRRRTWPIHRFFSLSIRLFADFSVATLVCVGLQRQRGRVDGPHRPFFDPSFRRSQDQLGALWQPAWLAKVKPREVHNA